LTYFLLDLSIRVIILYYPPICKPQREIFILVQASSFFRDEHRVDEDALVPNNLGKELGSPVHLLQCKYEASHVSVFSHYDKFPVILVW